MSMLQTVHRTSSICHARQAQTLGACDAVELEHGPEKWVPVFRKDHAQIKEIERDDDSKKRHPALVRRNAGPAGGRHGRPLRIRSPGTVRRRHKFFVAAPWPVPATAAPRPRLLRR